MGGVVRRLLDDGRRRAIAPDGTEWELTIVAAVLPQWRAGDEAPGMSTRLWNGEGPLGAVFQGILVPLFRYGFELGFTNKGREPSVRWIEAKSFYPTQETYYWKTTPKRASVALAEIATAIESGAHVPPRVNTAEYNGTTQL